MQAIEDVNQKLQKDIFRKVLGSKVVTELQPAGDYYIAEKYHQQVNAPSCVCSDGVFFVCLLFPNS